MSNKAPLLGLDGLRIFAALAVLFYHFTYLISVPDHTGYRITKGIVHFDTIGAISQYGWIGVEAFFLISGFVIAMSADGAGPAKFLTGRILRLVPTVWICAPITFAVTYAIRDASTHDLTVRLIRSLLFIPVGQPIDGTYWTLGIEVNFYACVFLILFLNMWKHVSIFLYALAIVSLFYNFVLLYGIFDPKHYSRIAELLLLRHGVFFALGAVIYTIKLQGFNFLRLIFALAALAGCFLEISVRNNETETQQGVAAHGLFFVCLAAFCASIYYSNSIGAATSRYSYFIRKLGMATYPLYLIHQLIGSALLYVFVSSGLAPILSLSAVIAVIFLLTFAITVAEPLVRSIVKMALDGIASAFQTTLGFIKRTSKL